MMVSHLSVLRFLGLLSFFLCHFRRNLLRFKFCLVLYLTFVYVVKVTMKFTQPFCVLQKTLICELDLRRLRIWIWIDILIKVQVRIFRHKQSGC